jgi:MFS family permease
MLAVLVTIYFSFIYFLFTTLTLVFEDEYNFRSSGAGLSYIGIGIGLLLGVSTMAITSKRQTKHSEATIKPEERLRPIFAGSLIFPIGLFWYGWAAEYHIHWIVPIIGTSLVGFAGTLAFLSVQMYLVDCFNSYAASATATNTVARNLVGALLPLAGGKLYKKLGLGWGNSLLGFICIAMVPMLIILFKYGERIRTSPRFQVKL